MPVASPRRGPPRARRCPFPYRRPVLRTSTVPRRSAAPVGFSLKVVRCRNLSGRRGCKNREAVRPLDCTVRCDGCPAQYERNRRTGPMVLLLARAPPTEWDYARGVHVRTPLGRDHGRSLQRAGQAAGDRATATTPPMAAVKGQPANRQKADPSRPGPARQIGRLECLPPSGLSRGSVSLPAGAADKPKD